MIELVFIGIKLYEPLFYKNMTISRNIIKKYKADVTSNRQEATTYQKVLTDIELMNTYNRKRKKEKDRKISYSR